MKKIIAIVLMFVLVFSFSVSAFAADELSLLGDIAEYTQIIGQYIYDDIVPNQQTLISRTGSILDNLVDINDFTRSNNTVLNNLYSGFFGDGEWTGVPLAENLVYYLDEINGTLVSMDSTVKNINLASLALYGLADGNWDTYPDSWFVKIYDDIHQLREVLADDEDLAFKESQKENQQYIQDTFFTPGNDLSLDVSKLTDFTNQFTDFTESFDFIEKVGTSTSPLESISEGSEFSQWFTTETGQDMDPTFGGGSGGGSGGGGDSEPLVDWLPLAYTTYLDTTPLNGVGYREDCRLVKGFLGLDEESVSGTCCSGWIPCKPGDIIYFQNIYTTAISDLSFFLYKQDSSLFWSSSSVQLPSDGIDEPHFTSFSVEVPSNHDFTFLRFNFRYSGEVVPPSVYINQNPNSTVSVASYSLDEFISYSSEPEIVTTAYSDRMNEFYSLLGGDY